MNKDRIKLAIEILTAIPETHFDIDSEFNTSFTDERTADKFKEPACGTTACALGWMALDPECQALGFKPDTTTDNILCGIQYKGEESASAGAAFFDIDYEKSAALFAYNSDGCRDLYNKGFSDITQFDVIYQLEFLRLTGELHWGHHA